jgi:hypothetical protein
LVVFMFIVHCVITLSIFEFPPHSRRFPYN